MTLWVIYGGQFAEIHVFLQFNAYAGANFVVGDRIGYHAQRHSETISTLFGAQFRGGMASGFHVGTSRNVDANRGSQRPLGHWEIPIQSLRQRRLRVDLSAL